MRDLYAVLGVSRDADQSSIRKAFKKLAREFHPDLNQDAGAPDRFKEVNAAYEVLGDDEKRRLYDEFGEVSLKPGFDPARARQWGSMGGGMPGGMPGGFGGGVNIDDLLGSFFGGGQTRRGPARGPRKGPDVRRRIDVPFMTAIQGGEHVVSIRRQEGCGACGGRGGTGPKRCGACHGSGKQRLGAIGPEFSVRCAQCGGNGTQFAEECEVCVGAGTVSAEKRLRLKIPAGVEEGRVIRLRGKGGPGSHNAPPGDLMLEVHVLAHPHLERRGPHLYMDVPITLQEALLGAKIEVPTPDGAVRVSVPPGTQSGQRLRLRGRGVPSDGRRGDLFLVLRPSVPTGDSDDLQTLVAALEAHYPPDGVRSGLTL